MSDFGLLLFVFWWNQPPSSDVQDKVAFIINNIVTANLEQKAKECLEVLKEQYYPWFAQYMVMKR
jgi:CCR4-NOT transcription complex subunit 1